jgi:MFS superfamily sulfate permease-like transporter
LGYDIKTGILISVGVSLLLTIKDATAMRVRILGRDPITRTWEPIDTKKTETEEVAREIEEEIPGVLIVKIRESLSFANVGGLKERLRRLEMCKLVLLHCQLSLFECFFYLLTLTDVFFFFSWLHKETPVG